MTFRLIFAAIFLVFVKGYLLAADDPQNASTQGAESVQAEEQPEIKEAAVEPEKKKRRASRLSREEQLEFERKLLGNGLKSRDGTAFRDEWSFKSGVTNLNTPYYDGWVNLIRQKGAFEDFSEGTDPNDLLVGILVNRNYVEATDSDYINFYSLVWVPQDFAYSLFSQRNFDAYKTALREQMVVQRKVIANRDDFETFEDYVRFKFGRDEEMESFADGYMIEASESDDHLTYFFTFEATRQGKKDQVVASMVGTLSHFLVRDKLIKLETRMEYNSIDDVSRVLEFSDRFRQDFVKVNSIQQ